MRITNWLLINGLRPGGREKHIFNDKWQAYYRKKVVREPIPPIARNMKIVNVKDVVDPKIELPIVEVPEPWRPMLPVRNSSHPLWKEKICHVFTNQTRLLEALNQSQLLTNTVLREGLHPHVEKLIGVNEKEKQDELVKKAIILSHINDGYQVRLPKIIDPLRLQMTFTRVYSIPVERKIKLLVSNILRIMEVQANSSEEVMKRNSFTNAKTIQTFMKDNDLIQFDIHADILLTSKTPIRPLATADEVAEIQDTKLPDIYPMKYTVDLAKTNIYDQKDFFHFSNFKDNHMHTVYLYDYLISETNPAPHEEQWSSPQKLAKALNVCFSFAATKARSQYGENITTLPEPVVIQCVLTDGRLFSFLSYQLNTLDINSSSKERNIAWIEANVPLYERCADVNGNILLGGYNSDVYENLLAFYLNGMSTTSQPNLRDLLNTMKMQSRN